MAPRRRALRDFGDARPLMALARTAVRESVSTRRLAEQGLDHHLQAEADCRMLPDSPVPAAPPASRRSRR